MWDAPPSAPALGKCVPVGVQSCSAHRVPPGSRLRPSQVPGRVRSQHPRSSFLSILAAPEGMGNAGAAPPGKSLACRVAALQHAALPSPDGRGLYSDATATLQFCMRLKSTSSVSGLSKDPQERMDPPACSSACFCATQAPSCPSQGRSMSFAGPLPLRDEAPEAQ